MTKAEKEAEAKRQGFDAFHSIETWHIVLDGWKATVAVYDEAMRAQFPHFKGTASLLAAGNNTLAVAISSAATRIECNNVAAQMIKAMGIQLEEGTELYQHVCNDIGGQLFSYAVRYGEEDNGHD